MNNNGSASFPAGFVWGAASSAYQIEGGWDADGKGPSVWDLYTHDHVPAGWTGLIGGVTTPGNVYMNHTGDTGCDHYHRFREDVGLMKQMGLKAYRFSISWPRVMPTDERTVNAKGLDFYSELVDELLNAGITPYVTLFHWDLPLWAYRRGGWLNREVSEWFAIYAAAVAKRLGDRVSNWMTLNEPHIFLGPGLHEGLQTSNARKGHAERVLTAHHALMCHGRGAIELRANAKLPAIVGWAPIGRCKVPATNDPRDVEAAKIATHAVTSKDYWNNAGLGDPVVLGHYPEDGLKLYHDDLKNAGDGGEALRAVNSAADLKLINQKLDFYGINVYDAERIRMGDKGPEKVDFPPGHPQNALRWFVEPDSLYYGPLWLYEKYKVPIYVTENGMTNLDWVDTDGRVRDPQRIDYTRRYLRSLRRAIADGADVRGYFHWSIMDNFEWQCGYRERFGLIHVDYATGERTLKDSAHWYRTVIDGNGATI